MTLQTAPDLEADPTLAVAERQLVLLGELAQIAMMAARAFGSSAVAAAEAEQRILAEEWYTPEVGRARACGAKDAAESLQKVSRAVRLTLKLEMAVAEIVRDIRAGVVTHTAATVFRDNAGGTPAELETAWVRQSLPRTSSRGPAGSCSDDDVRDRDRREADTEPLVEFDRPDSLPGALFRAAVAGCRADLGAADDWTHGRIEAPEPPSRLHRSRPQGWSERLPPENDPPPDLPALADLAAALPP